MTPDKENSSDPVLKVLIADDVLTNRTLASKVLERKGHQVMAVEDGLQAYEAFQKEIYDVITMWDYIEHSPVPMNDIKESFALLKPGGLLVLATPDISSWPAKVFKKKWMVYKDHEHLYYF